MLVKQKAKEEVGKLFGWTGIWHVLLMHWCSHLTGGTEAIRRAELIDGGSQVSAAQNVARRDDPSRWGRRDACRVARPLHECKEPCNTNRTTLKSQLIHGVNCASV